MSNFHKLVSGQSVHIRDCCLWSEIHYLDSPTDYRELLSQYQLQAGTALHNDILPLGSAGSWTGSRTRFGSLLGWVLSSLAFFLATLLGYRRAVGSGDGIQGQYRGESLHTKNKPVNFCVDRLSL